jgi:hypothetical protein
VEWWRTCCEPGSIDDSREAGAARILVAISGESKPRALYRFDVVVPGGYWGNATGYPVRQWTVVNVYPAGAAPLVWTWR